MPISIPSLDLRSIRRRLRVWQKNRALAARIAKPVSGPTPGSHRPRVLIFAPEAGVDPHFHMMCMVAKSLQSLDHDVWISRCFDRFARCPTMGARRAPFQRTFPERKEICRSCLNTSLQGTDTYGLNTFDLSSLEDRTFNEELAEAISDLPDDLFTFEHDGINFGYLCAFEVCVGMKRSHLDSRDPEVRVAWSMLIESALKSYFLVRKAIQTHGFTHVAYFNDYSMMLSAGLAAERYGAVPRLISQASHRNVDRRRCVVYQRSTAQNHYTIASRWKAWRDIPIAPRIVEEIAEDSFTRFLGVGSHLYSPPKDVSSPSTNLKKSIRRIVAYTSSPDEWAGGFMLFKALQVPLHDPALTFGGSIEHYHSVWLKTLALYLQGRDDIELIIRIHPREGANKLDSNASSHLALLQEALADVPENCRVIWPEEKISSYDLAETSDMVLTSWSTMGLEMARLGVPVLCSTLGVSGFVADDFQEFVATEEEYFSKLESLIAIPPSLARMKRAYRWWNLFCLGSSVDLSDLVPAPDYTALPPYRTPARAMDLEQCILGDSNIFDLNHQRLIAENNTEAAETDALFHQNRRILFYLLNIENCSTETKLVYVKIADSDPETVMADQPWLKQSRSALLIIDCNRELVWIQNGRVLKKFSPMAARLAFLASDFAWVPDEWISEIPPRTIRVDSWLTLQDLP